MNTEDLLAYTLNEHCETTLKHMITNEKLELSKLNALQRNGILIRNRADCRKYKLKPTYIKRICRDGDNMRCEIEKNIKDMEMALESGDSYNFIKNNTDILNNIYKGE
ncbi:MAG TPA: hypothetical protein PLC53_02760 [Bacilli bacterium]|nr:hypothetical protein [Bacilli bacterium]